MIQIQILNKILATNDFSIVEDNQLDEEYFSEFADEFNFIKNHIDKYGNVPDKATFISNFPEFEFVDVTESDKYLVDTIREEYLFKKSQPVIQEYARILKTDSNAASEYIASQLQNLQPTYDLGGVDIISSGESRFDKFTERKHNQLDWFFTTGFEELDDIIHGIQRGEELVTIVARINQGKSWFLAKICTHIWEIGFNVGYLSPEMSADSIGYRFDTLHKHYSNKGLMWGNSDVDNDDYNNYIEELSQRDNKFIVSTPLDFNHKVTVTKLKNWVKQNKLDIIAIDGVTYLTDERFKNGDNKTTSLTNISEDLMTLSLDLKIPVLIVVQANRSGVQSQEEDGTPELENIKDSDGIGANATKVLALQQKKNGVVEIGIKKNRFGSVGGKLHYNWDINMGNYTFIPCTDDAQPKEKTEKKIRDVKKKYKDNEDVF